MVADIYRDPAGRRVLLLRTPNGFPVARGARTDPPVGDWIAEVDEVVLVCADRPSASLVIGEDRAAVLVAATQLGLQ